MKKQSMYSKTVFFCLFVLCQSFFLSIAEADIAFVQSSVTVNEGAGTLTVEIQRTNAGQFNSSQRVSISANADTASSQDFGQPNPQSFTFNGNDRISVSIPITEDQEVENSEQFTLSLNIVPSAATSTFEPIGSDMSITIQDNDIPVAPDTVALTQSAISIHENDGQLVISAIRTNVSPQSDSLTIFINADDGTATQGQDYTFPTLQQLSWGSGEAGTKSFSIPILRDQIIEGNEDFDIDIIGVSSDVTIFDDTETIITIIDANPGQVSLDAATYSVDENAGNATIRVIRTQGSDGRIRASLATVNDSAQSGSDYSAVTRTLAWSDGDTSSRIIQIPITADNTIEATEQFRLVLNPLDGARSGQITQAVVQITENPGIIQFDQTSYTVAENDGQITVSLTRTGDAAGTAAVQLSSTPGSADANDFVGINQSISWAPGESGSKSLSISITPDQLQEGDETFNVSLSNPQGAQLGTANQAIVTIKDIPPALPSVSIVATTPIASELDLIPGSMTISRTGDTTNPLNITLDISGTATAGTDYQAIASTVTIPAGASDIPIAITPLADSETDLNESVIINLSDSNLYQLGSPATATVSIIDNTEVLLPILSIAATTPIISESDQSPGIVTITRSTDDIANPLSVNLTISGTATAGSDYQTIDTNVTIPTGVTGVAINITALPDTEIEADETIIITLEPNLDLYSINGDSSTTVTIEDGTPPPPAIPIISIESSSSTATELDQSPATVTIRRDGDTTNPLTVNLDIGGTAVAGVDFQQIPSSLTIPADSSAETISITPLNDTELDPDETIIISLRANPALYALPADPVVTISIIDNIPPLTVSLEPSSPTITDQNVTINVSFAQPLSRAIVLDYQTVDDTAIAGTDYVAKSESLSLASGTSNVSIVVDLLSSALRAGRQFQLNFSSSDTSVQINPNLVAVLLDGGLEGIIDDPTLSGNQKSIGTALVEACRNTESAALLERCAEIIALNDPDQATALTALIQDETSGIVTQMLRIGSTQFSNINRRISTLKSGQQNMVSLGGFSLNIEGEAVPIGTIAQGLLDMARGGNAGDSIADSEKLGFFMSGNISFGNKDTTNQQTGFDFDTQGVTLGMDYRFTDQFVAGVALGYAFTDTDFDDKGGTESHAGSINLYGSYFLPQDIYLDMVGHFGYHASENSRSIRYSGFSGQANSDTNGLEYGLNISLGKQWDFDSWKFNPYARFEYIEVLINNYSESSRSGLAVAIDQVDGRSLKSVLGTQIGKAFGFSWGVIQPSVNFEWLHEFEANATNISGHFLGAAAGTGRFNLVSDSPDRDFFNLGASVAATFAEGRSIYFNHESRLGQQGINSYRFELGVRIPF